LQSRLFGTLLSRCRVRGQCAGRLPVSGRNVRRRVAGLLAIAVLFPSDAPAQGTGSSFGG
jgi:hypothetical protein